MRRSLVFFTFVCLLAASVPALAAGSEKKEKAASPETQAVANFNAGVTHRDRAWKLDEQLAATTDAGERAKIEAKIEKALQSAAEMYEKAIAAKPDMFEAHSDLGYCLRRLGDYEKALESYDRALGLNPGYEKAIEYRGVAYLGLNRIDDAKSAYLSLFQKHSDEAPALLEAMQRYVEKRKGEGADVEAFAAWVAERAEIAGQTKTISQLNDADW